MISKKFVKEKMETKLGIHLEREVVNDFLGFMEENAEELLQHQWNAYLRYLIEDREEVMVRTNCPEYQYLYVQSSSEADYDYTFYDRNCMNADGGVLSSSKNLPDVIFEIIREVDPLNQIQVLEVLSEEEAEEVIEKDYQSHLPY